jgi:CRP-like cAMP-binding protein
MDILLNAIRQHIPLSPDEELVVRSLFRESNLQKGEHLLEVGSICRNIFFIERGLVRYYCTINGEEKTSYFNKEGEFVCDYASFLPQIPSATNIQALERCRVYAISHANIQLFYNKVAHGERFGRLALEEVFVNVISQVSSLYNDPPELRYSTFLSKYPDIAQRIPQYHIASYVGIKPQSLSRIRKRMDKKH